jgi:hypothetical protein
VKWARADVPGRSVLPPSRIPIRAPAVAATDDGRRARELAAGERAARSALCHPTLAAARRTCATAYRLHAGIR